MRLCRALATGSGVEWELVGHLAYLVALILIGTLLASRTFTRRLYE